MLIVLNGASSVGKTSLARTLQSHLEGPWVLMEEDRFVENTLAPFFQSKSLDDPVLEGVLRGYYRSLRAFLSVDFRVIADLGLYTERIAKTFEEETRDLPRLLIGVHCDPDELDRREALRGDRPLGLGRNQATFIHRHVRYDLEVDTTDCDLDRCAREIAACLA